jgi:hypothetical protein
MLRPSEATSMVSFFNFPLNHAPQTCARTLLSRGANRSVVDQQAAENSPEWRDRFGAKLRVHRGSLGKPTSWDSITIDLYKPNLYSRL